MQMQRIALHTRLAPGKEEEYEKVHAVIPADLDQALREAGVHTWRIWRDGRDLFHVVEVDDYQHMRAYLRDQPLPRAATISQPPEENKLTPIACDQPTPRAMIGADQGRRSTFIKQPSR